MKNPCKDCTDRTPGCHSGCKDYVSFKTEKEKINEQIRQEKAPIYERTSWSPTRRKRVRGYD